MIRVYDLSHHPQLGDVLTCRVYKKGQSLECIRIVANFVDQSDPSYKHDKSKHHQAADDAINHKL